MTSGPRSPLGAALRTSEVRYRRLFESARDGILILDATTGVIVDANPYLENLLGYARGEMVGTCLWDLGPFRDVAASREAFRHLQEAEYARYESLPLETRTKGSREVELISNAYLVDGQRVIQCNIREVGERERAAGELRTANEDLAALVTELKQRDAEGRLLHRVSLLLQACRTQQEACQVVALMAGELFAGQDGCLALRQPESPALAVAARWGRSRTASANFAASECWAIRRGQPHEVVDPRSGLLCRHFVAPPPAGYLCIPLAVQGESLGLLCLMNGDTGTREQHRIRRNMALTFGEAIQLSLYNLRLQAKLREQANRDELTGLFNRRYLEDSLDRELHRVRRQRSPLGLAMLDLDHLKQFNDAYGHEAGDLLLQHLGRTIGTALRHSDIACRYGGDEFVLILPDTSLVDTVRRVDELRALVRKLAVRHEDRLLGPITVSAGVAALPGHGSTARALLTAADAALYQAKREGRDRLVCLGAGTEPAPDTP